MLPTRPRTFTCFTHLKLLFDDDTEIKEVEYFTINENHHHDDTNKQIVEPSTPPSAIIPAQVAPSDAHDMSVW
jgi:hypothetical protein